MRKETGVHFAIAISESSTQQTLYPISEPGRNESLKIGWFLNSPITMAVRSVLLPLCNLHLYFSLASTVER
jgi:hypothetical protein